MATNGWTWANLNGTQLDLVAEAEATLGADFLLVYQPYELETPRGVRFALLELKAASLNEGQLECLQGLEEQIDSVVVAYRYEPMSM